MVKHAHLPLCGSLQPSLTPAVKCRYIHLVRTGWVLQRKDRGFGSKEWNHRVSQLEDPPQPRGLGQGFSDLFFISWQQLCFLWLTRGWNSTSNYRTCYA